jgi:purine-binding chemotaxis protein CheW
MTNGSLLSATAEEANEALAGQQEARDRSDVKSEHRQFVCFTVDEEEYAIDIMQVREIKGWTGVTVLPNQPESMRGVLNLRGAVIPIFDLRCRFSGEKTKATNTHVVIIASVGERLAGILVDAVSDILNVDGSEIRAAPTIEGHDDGGILAGLVTVDERMVTVLDHVNLLRGAEIDQVPLNRLKASPKTQTVDEHIDL